MIGSAAARGEAEAGINSNVGLADVAVVAGEESAIQILPPTNPRG